MKYTKMFDRSFLDSCSKASRRKYERIKDFIRTEERAERLDRMKVPNWYVEIFTDERWFNIGFISRLVTHKEKLELFEKLLIEKQEVRYRKDKVLLWKLKSYESYNLTGYLYRWKFSILTDEEKEERERLRLIAKAKYDKEHEEFRARFGNIFEGALGKLFGSTERHYKVLGIEDGASKEEIKKAYRKLCKIHHPDVGGDVGKFREITEAYQHFTR